jgi:hypothetical protein
MTGLSCVVKLCKKTCPKHGAEPAAKSLTAMLNMQKTLYSMGNTGWRYTERENHILIITAWQCIKT